MNRLIGLVIGMVLGVVPFGLSATDSATPVGAVNAFRHALASGDEQAALALLAPELLVYETGDQNRTRGEYAAHHLKADMAFLANARVRVLDQRTSADGALASVATRSRITWPSGDLVGTETMVLRREPDGWRIVHVHWSSRPAARNDD